MNLKQAAHIRVIAQEGSITAAAKRLYISQPSLSQMLKQVEKELGVPLFDRRVSPFRPTFAGEKYLQAAETMLAAQEKLENQMREIREENSGRLRLGISVQRATQVLPLALPWFIAQFPHVKLELIERGSAELEELVFQEKVDLALAAMESASPRLTYQLIEEEVVGLLAGKGASLTQTFPDGMPVSLDMAQGETFVCLKKGHSARVVQDALFRRYGLTPNILLETDSMEVARRAALGTGSCMLCSNIYIDGMVRRHGAFYPLKDYQNGRHFYAYCRRESVLPRYASEFIKIVTQVLKQERLIHM